MNVKLLALTAKNKELKKKMAKYRVLQKECQKLKKRNGKRQNSSIIRQSQNINIKNKAQTWRRNSSCKNKRLGITLLKKCFYKLSK